MSISAVPRRQISHSRQDSHAVVGVSFEPITRAPQFMGFSAKPTGGTFRKCHIFQSRFVNLWSRRRIRDQVDESEEGCLSHRLGLKPEHLFISYYGLITFGKYLQPRPYRHRE